MKTNHPRGLYVLFGTEMWERLSYYGMRSILMLYMITPFAVGGLGFDNAHAGKIYGTYTSSVYLAALLGGWLADRFLGARRAVLYGGIVIMLGHFSLAYPALETFYLGLGLLIFGTGMLKPNISAMVGGLYGPDDPRRDSGFSIFYMGINLGGFFAPFVCGTLAQAPAVRHWLESMGYRPEIAWHLGFAAAGVGMFLGLTQFLLQRKHLAHVGNCVATTKKLEKTPQEPLTRTELRRLIAIVFFFFCAAVFWMMLEQAGSSLTLFADQMTDNTLFGIPFPSSWFQSVNPIFIIALAPIFSMLWLRKGNRQPSSPAKFAYGLFYAGMGFAVLAVASHFTAGGRVSPLWLTVVYLFHTFGELYLSPVGLSVITKLAPLRMVGLMMGVWFLASSVGNFMAGWVARFFVNDAAHLVSFFGSMALLAFGGALLAVLLVKPIKSLMGGIR